jgi:hypothetical protein
VSAHARKRRSFDDVTLRRLTGLWLAYAAFALVARRGRLPTVCPFRLLTGHRCPLCGLTRSVNCLLHGELRRSFREHPAGPVLFAGSALFLAHAWRGEAIYPGRPPGVRGRGE